MPSGTKDRTPISPERSIALNPGVPSPVRSPGCLKCLMLSAFPAHGPEKPRSESTTRGPNGPADRQAQTAEPQKRLSRSASGSPPSSHQGSKRLPRRTMAQRPLMTWPIGRSPALNRVLQPYQIWFRGQDLIAFGLSRTPIRQWRVVTNRDPASVGVPSAEQPPGSE
jgi:hypothetical protein